MYTTTFEEEENKCKIYILEDIMQSYPELNLILNTHFLNSFRH